MKKKPKTPPTKQMRGLLNSLLETGLYGIDLNDAVERIVARALDERLQLLERFKKGRRP